MDCEFDVLAEFGDQGHFSHLFVCSLRVTVLNEVEENGRKGRKKGKCVGRS